MRQFIQPNIVLYFFLLALGVSGVFFALIWPETIGFQAFITFAGAGGFGVAYYIFHTKRHKGHLVCPVGSDCNAVVTSRYAKFFGIPLEYWGMAYYAAIVVSYGVLIFAPALFVEVMRSGLFLLTAAAFVFSLYLLFVQAFLLRQWCIWCLLSASLSIAIFIFSLASLDVALAVLGELGGVLDALRALGFALGVGGSTTAIFLFHRFLRDLDIDENEQHVLKGVSEVVWMGLALVLVASFAQYVTIPMILAHSSQFLAQMIAVIVAAVIGAILLIILAPFLYMIPFRDEEKRSFLAPLRKPIFIMGAIGVTSWYFAFSVDYVSAYGLATLLLAYGAALVAAIGASLLWEWALTRRRRS